MADLQLLFGCQRAGQCQSLVLAAGRRVCARLLLLDQGSKSSGVAGRYGRRGRLATAAGTRGLLARGGKG